MNAIEVKNIYKDFRTGFWLSKASVLKNLSFNIPHGEVTGFLGANGAGKTTSIKCILGLLNTTSGQIKYFGEDRLTSKAKSKIGFLPERPNFYQYLTGYELLQFFGSMSGKISRSDLHTRIIHLLKKVDLIHVKDRKVGLYSKGMLQKIGIAQALIHRPELVILDEPMSGLDPDGRYYLSQLISDTAKEGTAVFFSSHLLHDTQRLCNHIVVLKNGELFYQGDMNQFINKMNSDIKVKFLEGRKESFKVFKSINEAQAFIDQLRAKNIAIIEVKSESEDLEKAFVSLVMNKEGL